MTARRADFGMKPSAPRSSARRTLSRSLPDDDRYGWIALLQVGEHVEAVAVRQIQVEQDQLEVGMLLDELHRLAAIRSFQNVIIALPLPENALQRLANQHMIINHQDFHLKVVSAAQRARD